MFDLFLPSSVVTSFSTAFPVFDLWVSLLLKWFNVAFPREKWASSLKIFQEQTDPVIPGEIMYEEDEQGGGGWHILYCWFMCCRGRPSLLFMRQKPEQPSVDDSIHQDVWVWEKGRQRVAPRRQLQSLKFSHSLPTRSILQWADLNPLCHYQQLAYNNKKYRRLHVQNSSIYIE